MINFLKNNINYSRLLIAGVFIFSLSASSDRYDFNLKPAKKVSRDGFFRILSIDGGGVRGIIPATILASIEKATGKAITELFDMIVGTSTGGMIALYLNIPDDTNRQLFSAKEIVVIYKNLPKIIFNKSLINLGIAAKYDVKPLEKLLNDPDHFGQFKLSDAIVHVLVTSKDVNTGGSFLFSSAFVRKNLSKDFLMATAARATSAAPTFFRPAIVKIDDNEEKGDGVEISLIDGGGGSNNPAQDAVDHAIDVLGIDPSKIKMLSLGTGQAAQVGGIRAQGIFSGGLGMVKPTLDVLLMAQEDSASRAVKAIIGKQNFFRIAPKIPRANVEMDNTKDKNLTFLEEIGQRVSRFNVAVAAEEVKEGKADEAFEKIDLPPDEDPQIVEQNKIFQSALCKIFAYCP